MAEGVKTTTITGSMPGMGKPSRDVDVLLISLYLYVSLPSLVGGECTSTVEPAGKPEGQPPLSIGQLDSHGRGS